MRDRWLWRYEHCDKGGWWCSGIDILTGEPSRWGQFKPNQPYQYIKKQGDREFLGFGEKPQPKTIKYEPPRIVPTEIYALRVPLHIWQHISALNNVPLPDKIVIEKSGLRSQDSEVTNTELIYNTKTGEISSKFKSSSQASEDNCQSKQLLTSDSTLLTSSVAQGFWSWVLNNPSIPLTITEGAKKAGALLTAGRVAIALPGIWSGIRTAKDQFGKKTGQAFLIPQLKVFATKGREINFCYDNDAKPSSQKQVKKAILATGKLFEKAGCTVKVVTWNALEKGVDDFIVAHGTDAFETVYAQRKPLSSFKLLAILDLCPFVSLTINQRYLDGDLIPPPDAKIIGINSPKNTGKTAWLTIQVEKAISQGQKVLVITHRIQLAIALCRRFKIAHIEEIATVGDKNGFALCIDSLHADSLAQFDPEDWQGATIVVDECEQVFWHALNSNTLKSNRVKILTNFEILLKVALSTGGKIYLADADLSPIALQYVQKLIGSKVKTWVVQNLCIPNAGKRKLFTYDGNDPKLLLNSLIRAIAKGERVLIHTSGQKQQSKWGTTALEQFLQQKLTARGQSIQILRIDAKSVVDPQHPAYACTKNLDRVIPNYDVVLASPTVETGVSIDTVGHFNSVWCIAWGVQTVDAVCQSVERLRDDVPRHLWARTVGMKYVANRSTSVKKILASTHKQTRYHIAYLSQAGYLDCEDLDWDWQNPHLITWARRAAVVNTGMYKYKESIIAKLNLEGYQLQTYSTQDKDEVEAASALKDDLDSCVAQTYQTYCEAVSETKDISSEEYARLESKLHLTANEDLQLKKAKLKKRYGNIPITPELVAKDDKGWYSQLQLHYYLTLGNLFLAARDRAKFAELTQDRNKAFKPDLNKQQLALKVNGFQLMQIEQFLAPGAVFSDRTLKDWHQLVSSPLLKQEIKDIYGVNICDHGGPIANANKLLKHLNLKLVPCGWAGGQTDSHRLYQSIPIDHDGRAAVFAQWFERDFYYNCNRDLCLYLAHLSNSALSGPAQKIFLTLAAHGGQSPPPPPATFTVEDHSPSHCAWLLAQLEKFVHPTSHLQDWLDFFKSVEPTFLAATWNYLRQTKGTDRFRDLVRAIFAKGGSSALTATGVEF